MTCATRKAPMKPRKAVLKFKLHPNQGHRK